MTEKLKQTGWYSIKLCFIWLIETKTIYWIIYKSQWFSSLI